MGGLVHFTDSWSLTSLLRVGHRVATLLDSTRESILALRYNFWRLQGTQSCRGKPVLICILALSLVFTPYLLNAVVSAKSPHFFHALVALKLLVSLISRLVACSARIVVDKQTDRQTDRQTDTQTNYCNPRCACAPRVNYPFRSHVCKYLYVNESALAGLLYGTETFLELVLAPKLSPSTKLAQQAS